MKITKTTKTTKERERRTVSFEVRADEESRKIVGHAAVFDQAADIGGWFNEVIDRGAFDEAMGNDEIMALFNHDPNLVLGRTGNGTVKLTTDDTGLRYEIDLPDTPTGNEVLELVRSKTIHKSSFGFRVLEESYDYDTDTRTILKVELFDVSPVTYPAYEGTDVSARSIEGKEAAKRAAKAKRQWSLYERMKGK